MGLGSGRGIWEGAGFDGEECDFGVGSDVRSRVRMGWEVNSSSWRLKGNNAMASSRDPLDSTLRKRSLESDHHVTNRTHS